MSSDKETKGIRAAMIIEVLGTPPEHLTEVLNKLIKAIDEEKGVSVQTKKLHEPTLLKDQEKFYTTYAEVEVEVDEISYLAILMFKYMPAHIEIISPELIALTNNGWNEILNELTRRLHGYDEIARILQSEKTILEKKLREILPPEVKDEKKSNEKKPAKKKVVKKKK